MYKRDIAFDLEEKINYLQQTICDIDEKLKVYKKGTLVTQGKYTYLKTYKNGKTVSEYVGKDLTQDEIDDINRELKNSKVLSKRKREYINEVKELTKLLKKYRGN